MSAKGISFIVSEYHILWEALAYYESHLEQLSLKATDESEQLEYDEKLQDIEQLLRSLKSAALNDYGLKLMN